MPELSVVRSPRHATLNRARQRRGQARRLCEGFRYPGHEAGRRAAPETTEQAGTFPCAVNESAASPKADAYGVIDYDMLADRVLMRLLRRLAELTPAELGALERLPVPGEGYQAG